MVNRMRVQEFMLRSTLRLNPIVLIGVGLGIEPEGIVKMLRRSNGTNVAGKARTVHTAPMWNDEKPGCAFGRKAAARAYGRNH